MKIYRYKTKEEVYGFVEPADLSIWIRADLRGYHYYDTLWHEVIHYWILKYVPTTRFKNLCNMVFDITHGILSTLDLKVAKNYWREYVHRI